MKIQKHLIVTACLTGLLTSAAYATEPDRAEDQSVYAAVGAFGASIGYEKRFGFWDGHWGTRLALNSGGLSRQNTHADLSDNTYDLKVKTGAGISTLLDYYPKLDSGWRLTGGVILSTIRSDLAGRSDGQGNYQFNNHTYSASQVGTVDGQLKYNPMLAYLGLGWESGMSGTPGWRFVSDAGLFVTGKAKVKLNASGAQSNAALDADLQAERERLQKRAVGVMVQLGAAYAF